MYVICFALGECLARPSLLANSFGGALSALCQRFVSGLLSIYPERNDAFFSQAFLDHSHISQYVWPMLVALFLLGPEQNHAFFNQILLDHLNITRHNSQIVAIVLPPININHYGKRQNLEGKIVWLFGRCYHVFAAGSPRATCSESPPSQPKD